MRISELGPSEARSSWGDELFALEDEAEAIRVLKHRYHAVVGNPPYVTEKDPKKREVVWAKKGSWRKQHEPVLLPSGTMLLFDNQKGGTDSNVLEFDPVSMKEVWSYRGGKDGAFYSAECGVASRLPNGNTLVVESLNGRAFEVNPAKKIVWEYYNPYRAGDKAQLIATLFDLVRLGPGFSLKWLEDEE